MNYRLLTKKKNHANL